MNGNVAIGERLVLVVDDDVIATGNAGLTPSAGYDGGVTRHTATRGKNTGSGVHPADVFRAGLDTNKDDLLAVVARGLGILSGEDDLAHGGAGRGREATADHIILITGFIGEAGVQQQIEARRLHSRLGGRTLAAHYLHTP